MSKFGILTKDQSFDKFKIERNFKFNFELIKSIDSKKKKERIIKGYASTTDKDRTDDIITMDALKKCKDDLLKSGSTTVFYNHDRSFPIGKVIETSLDSKGLIVTIKISDAKDVDDIWTKINEGILNSLSIGGRFKKVKVDRDADGEVVGFKVLELELFEVSVVGIPANANASIFSVVEKAFAIPNKEKGEMKKEDEKKESGEKIENVNNTTKVLTIEDVNKMIEDKIAPMSKSIGELVESIKKLAEVTSKKEDTGSKEVVKAETTVEIPAWAKELGEKVNTLTTKLERPIRKGGVEEVKEEEVVEVDETPKKSLKDHTDPDTISFVKYVFGDTDEFKKLSESEQGKAKAIYFKLLHDSTKKDRK